MKRARTNCRNCGNTFLACWRYGRMPGHCSRNCNRIWNNKVFNVWKHSDPVRYRKMADKLNRYRRNQRRKLSVRGIYDHI